ncbi:kinase-like domain-containing protein [Ganoderma leucocontextum]|nr:kinase-like domain-containing protein [Ganoderma leucocontextum]
MTLCKALSYIQRKICDVQVVQVHQSVEAASIPGNEYGAALGAQVINLVVDASKNLPPQENIHVKMKFDPTGEMLTCEVEHLSILDAACGFTQVDAHIEATPSSFPSSSAAIFSHSLSLGHLKESARAHLPPVSPTPPLCSARFRVHRILGVGGMGTVALVAHEDTRQYFALKVIKKNDLHKHEQPLVPQLKASFQDDEHFFFLTEFCSKGSLDKTIYKAKPSRLSESDARRYIVQLILAIENLHSRKIIHRDLKPSNILLNAHDQVQLADFGLARQFGPPLNQPWRGDSQWEPRDQFERSRPSVERSLHHSGAEKDYTMSRGGTWGYMSPEAIGGRAVSYPADVWGVGVCMYEMLFGKLPFDIKPKSTKRQISFLVLSTPVKFDSTVTLHAFAKDLLRKLLDKDPSARITMEQVKMHPWFESVDWDAVAKKCSMRKAVHWYAREGDEPTISVGQALSALDVEFGTHLTSPMDRARSQETSAQPDGHERASSSSADLDVEVIDANTNTSCTYDASHGPFVSMLCEGSSATLASPNVNEAKKTNSATRSKLKVKEWWTRLTTSSKHTLSPFCTRHSQRRGKRGNA